MTSRERVLAAINHQEPDRIPLDFGAMPSTGIQAVAYARLKRYLEMTGGDIFVYDPIQNLAQPEDWFLERFQVDVVSLARVFLTRPEERQPWVLVDGTPASLAYFLHPESDDAGGWRLRDAEGHVLGIAPAGQPYFTQSHWPLADGVTPERLADLPHLLGQTVWFGVPGPPFYQPLTDEFLQEVARRAQALRENTDYAIMVSVGCNLLEGGQILQGFGEFLYTLAADPPTAHALLERLVEVWIANLERILPYVGPYVDIVQVGDDLGTQHGPQISPKMYEEFFLARHRAVYQRIKQLAPVKVFQHNCGGLYELMPLLIQSGVDILNPVQTSAAGMEPERLKREFGRDLCFWGGGCEVQGVLTHGTPEQVREQVRDRKRIFGPGGGFVFNQIHNVLMNVSPQNVIAMLETAVEE